MTGDFLSNVRYESTNADAKVERSRVLLTVARLLSTFLTVARLLSTLLTVARLVLSTELPKAILITIR